MTKSEVVYRVKELLNNLTLQTRMITYVVVLVLIQLIIISVFAFSMMAESHINQLGKRAIAIGHSIASYPQIALLIEQDDPQQKIQQIVEAIREKADAEFIVVGDTLGKRYSHPNPKMIGKLMVGGDNYRALVQKESYISRAIGTLGPSLRAKVPITNTQGKVVGVVSIGFLEKTINNKSISVALKIIVVVMGLFFIGIVSATFLAKSFKKAIFGLEPNEISRLFTERNAIIESVHEGIIATDANDNVTLLNKNAANILKLNTEIDYCGEKLSALVPGASFSGIINSGKSMLDVEVDISDTTIIVNSLPIYSSNRISGVVSSFRLKDQLYNLGKELSQIKDYSELLRAQTHEYSNKLHTISGLIQLGAVDEAVQLISSETTGYQELLQLLLKAVPDPIIAGCLLGKYNRAKELGINFTLDKESRFVDVPSHINKQKIVTIMGNLISNAFDSILKNNKPNKEIVVSLIDLGHDLIIEVEDSGVGIPVHLSETIFSKGFSTNKEQGRGMGLSIVKDALTLLSGQITISKSALGGALFTVYISKEAHNHG